MSVDSDAVSSYISSVVDWSPNTSLVFGEGDPELDGLKTDFHLCVDQILACFYNLQAGIDQMICGVPFHAKVLLNPLVMLWPRAVGFPDGQLAEYCQNPSLELNVVLRGQDWAEKNKNRGWTVCKMFEVREAFLAVWWNLGRISSHQWSFCRLQELRTWLVCKRGPGGCVGRVTMHFAKMLFLRINGTPNWDQKLRSEMLKRPSRGWLTSASTCW